MGLSVITGAARGAVARFARGLAASVGKGLGARLALAGLCVCAAAPAVVAVAQPGSGDGSIEGAEALRAYHAARIEEAREEARRQGGHWTPGWTSLTERTPEELEALRSWRPPAAWLRRWQGDGPPARVRADLPSAFNWFAQGSMTPVKNQQGCGSCWDFSAVAALEAVIKIETGVEHDLSEQQVLSCATYGWGCSGGWPDIAWTHLRESGAIGEACFPYQASDAVPCAEAGCPRLGAVSSWVDIPNDIEAIKTAIYERGPVTTGFTVYNSFYYYTGGCYSHPGTDPNNHSVVLAGWDDDLCAGGAWLVKNSWGGGWGVGGYAWVQYGSAGIGRATQQVRYHPGTEIELAGVEVDDGESGDGDGWLDPGEEARLVVRLRNGVLAAARTGIRAILVSESPGVTVLRRQGDCPDLAPGERGAVEPAFRVAVDPFLDVGARVRMRVGVIARGGYSVSDTFSLQIGDLPVLLVDDDGSTVADPFFRDALDAEGYAYRHWDTSLRGTPPAEILSRHAAVVWLTGITGNLEGPDQAALSAYLDGGGSLLVSGQDIGWWMNEAGGAGDRAFYNDYLRADYVADDSGFRTLQGFAGDPIGDGLSFTLGGGDGSRSQDYPSWIRARGGAQEILHYGSLPMVAGALRWEGSGRLVYLAFGLEAIDTRADRRLLLSRALEWLVPEWPDTQRPAVDLVSPNGGEVWDFLDEVEIRWQASDESGIAGIDLHLSRDGGATFGETLARGLDNDGSHIWRVVGTGSAACRIRVVARDSLGLAAFDESDQPFTILQPPAAVDAAAPGETRFLAEGPNPFSTTTALRLALPAPAVVRVSIHDLAGRELARLQDGPLAAGDWRFPWAGRDGAGRGLPGGVYFGRVESPDPAVGRRVARLLLLR